MAIGKSVQRVDGIAKVTGKARYTDDFSMPGMRVAKYLRSTMAHGRVTSINVDKAKSLPGIEAVFTFDDVPDIEYATAGHPYSLDPSYKDIADRRLLTDHVRYEGDEIAIVVADDELTAEKALELIEVEYEELQPLVRIEDILAADAPKIHDQDSNVVRQHVIASEGDPEAAKKGSDHVLRRKLNTQIMQHCHLENHTAYAYMDDLDTLTIVSSTQIPHIVRRIVSEALNHPLGKIRVIKPYIGGGFGNKQDVVLEPMVAFLTSKLGGIPVSLRLDREECMVGTRVRHPFEVDIELGFDKDGTINVIDFDAVSITGAYASHGHSVVSAGAGKAHYMYPRAVYHCNAKTIYGNFPASGAMRGYGSPQMAFVVESIVEEAARTIGMDPVEFRLKNVGRPGDVSRLTNKTLMTCGLPAALEKGREMIRWDEKRADWPASQSGDLRRGLGVACFSYGSGTFPACVEPASARLILNQDGSAHLQIGATEIGQGSDTALAQMAAETTGLSVNDIHVVSVQDTDVTPFDTGAYASRQMYVGGQAVMRAARELKEKILEHAAEINGMEAVNLDIIDSNVVIAKDPGIILMPVGAVAVDAYYNKTRGGQITAEATHKTRSNAHTFGCTFVDLVVDVPMCQVKINEIYNIHDCGIVINPLGAEGQVHGGMAMGIGAALYETLLVDPDSGKIHNNNMLDYKVPTIMDIPDLNAAFVETDEPSNPYGAKSLGEPPCLSQAPAIRNAILDATGVAIHELPLNPKTLFTHFKSAGLI